MPIALDSIVNAQQNFSGIALKNISLTGYNTVRQDLGSVSGTVNLDLSSYSDFTATIAGNTTFNITNTPSTGVAGFSLNIYNGGSATVTFTNAKYPAATAPTLTTSGYDVITFVTYDAGTTWRGTISMKDSR